MSQIAASIDIETAKNVATGVSVGSVVVALFALRLVKNMIMRALAVVLLLALGLASYSQRSNIVDCAEKVKSTAGVTDTTCTFFGQDVKLPAIQK